MNLYLVRHGHTSNNLAGIAQGHLDSELDLLGEFQANRVAEFFTDRPIKVIYSSDLKRCTQTAGPTAAERSLPIHFTPELRERFLGDYEGKSIAELVSGFETAQIASELSVFDLKPGQCESAREVEIRAHRFLTSINNLTEDTAIFTHGMMKEVLLCALIGASVEVSRSFSFDNGSISMLSRLPNGWLLRLYNHIDHLRA